LCIDISNQPTIRYEILEEDDMLVLTSSPP